MGKRKILSVEDNPELATMMRTFLESNGYVVLQASDGEQAVQLAEQERPDLILMDIQLPVVSGLEATRRIRRTYELAATPIVAVTGFAMEEDAASAFAAGCNDYITKPYEFEELIKIVQRLLK